MIVWITGILQSLRGYFLPAVVITGGVGFVSIGGYTTYKLSEQKVGIIVHDQGPMIYTDKTSWDLYNKPREFAEFIFDYTDGRFHNGASYQAFIVGDSIYTSQDDLYKWAALTYHASGFNSPSIGVGLARTDDPNLNEKTLNSFEVLHDSLNTWSMEKYGKELMFCVFHSDVAAKDDPHEFRDPLVEKGLRYDKRPWPQNLDLKPFRQ